MLSAVIFALTIRKEVAMLNIGGGNAQEPCPGWKRVLLDFLEAFEPTETYQQGATSLISTDEIISELASMADMEPSQVADTLSELGFRSFHTADGIHGWLLRKRL